MTRGFFCGRKCTSGVPRHRHPRHARPANKAVKKEAVEDPVHLRSHRGVSLLHAWAILVVTSHKIRCCNARLEAHRWTSTGILEWVSTLSVSLPRTIAEMPWRPCEAMTTRSHPFNSAVSIIAW